MIALEQLFSIYLFVNDVVTSKDWYSKVLNLKPIIELQDYAEFKVNQFNHLCLHPQDLKSPLSTGGCVGYWKVKNIKSAIEHFQNHGAKIYRGPLLVENHQQICQMLDPFGNIIGLIGS